MQSPLRLSPLRLSALFLSALLLSVLQLSAAPPSGGGGGGGTAPAGTIHFSWYLPTLDGWEDRGDWTMTGGGTGKQLRAWQEPFDYSGTRLSHQVHGATHWLLEYGTNPTTGDFSLYAKPVTGGASVLLADSMSITGTPETLSGGGVWGKDDSFVSVITRENTPGAFCQIYRADIDFVGGVPVVSSSWGFVTAGDLPEKTDIANCDWSFDGTKLAMGMIPNDGQTQPYINIWDANTDTTTVLTSDGYNPRWSPTANRIAYKPFNQGIFTVNPDGTGLTQLTTGNMDLPQDWSPDGKYIVFQRSGVKSAKGGYVVDVSDVCTVPSAGGKAVNLTGDIDGFATPRWWR